MREIELFLTEPQEQFVFSEAKHPAMCAGYGAGKSQAGVIRILLRAIKYPGLSFAFVEPTFDLVRLIAWPRFEEILHKWGISYRLNKSESIMTLANGSRIVFRSADNPSRLVGFEVADAVIDEADVLSVKDASDTWVKMLARARQKKPDGANNTVGCVSTPEGFKWMYETFERNKRPGYELIRAPTSSNPYLPDGYLDTLKATYSSALLAAYCDGYFVNLTSGSVYPEFDRALNASTETIREKETLHIGLDFNVSHMAAVVHVLRDDDPHAVEEITEVFDTPAMAKIIKERYRDHGHSIMVYPDASGGGRRSNNASESDLAILKQHGFQVCNNPANPAVKDRVLSVNRMLHNEGVRRYRINSERCPSLVESLEKQAYDKNGEPAKDGGLDHICFSASTLVTTEDGVFRFDEIAECGRVIGPYGEFVEYKNAKQTGNKITVRVEFASGYVIECTHNHLFLTRSGKWVQAQDLTGLECVLSVQQNKRLMGLSTTFAGNIFKNLTRQARSVYTGLCGCITQVLSQTNSIFTILTGIGRTIRLKTSLASTVENTLETTQTTEKRNFQKSDDEISQAQKHGTRQMMVLSGTKSIIYPMLGNFTRHIKKCAHVAVLSLKQKSQSETSQLNFAQGRARHTIDGRLALTTLLESAFHVEQNSRQISTVQGSVVNRVSLLGTQDVYCLTVPDYGCFKLSKESPIVSNCDAAGYMISYRYPIQHRKAIVTPLRM